MSNKLTVMMYHYVRDLRNTRYPNIKGCDIRDFREQIKYIKKHYNPISVEQVISCCENKEESLPEHPILLTFDDGYADHFEYVMPVLYHEHIQGVFFAPVKAVTEHTVLDVNKVHFILATTPEDKIETLIKELERIVNENKDTYDLLPFERYYEKYAIANRFDTEQVIFVKRMLQVALPEQLRQKVTTDLFERSVGMDERVFSRELYMTMDQMKCMVECGMQVGSHGYNHCWLSSLSKERQEFEISKSIDFIKSIGGDDKNWTIGYPYGDFNDETITLLKQHGCKMGFTTQADLADIRSEKKDFLFKLPRIDVNDLPKNAEAPVNEWFFR